MDREHRDQTVPGNVIAVSDARLGDDIKCVVGAVPFLIEFFIATHTWLIIRFVFAVEIKAGTCSCPLGSADLLE